MACSYTPRPGPMKKILYCTSTSAFRWFVKPSAIMQKGVTTEQQIFEQKILNESFLHPIIIIILSRAKKALWPWFMAISSVIRSAKPDLRNSLNLFLQNVVFIQCHVQASKMFIIIRWFNCIIFRVQGSSSNHATLSKEVFGRVLDL